MNLPGNSSRGKLFTSRFFLFYLLTVLLISLIAVLILLLSHSAPSPQGEAELPRSSTDREFPYHRILIPEERLELIPSDFVPIREPREYWDAETVERYWIDPAPIVEELLADENRLLVEDILEALP